MLERLLPVFVCNQKLNKRIGIHGLVTGDLINRILSHPLFNQRIDLSPAEFAVAVGHGESDNLTVSVQQREFVPHSVDADTVKAAAVFPHIQVQRGYDFLIPAIDVPGTLAQYAGVPCREAVQLPHHQPILFQPAYNCPASISPNIDCQMFSHGFNLSFR